MKRTVVFLIAAMLAFGMSSAHATLVNIDQIIYQSAAGTTVDPSMLSGTLDISVSGNTITILMTNTSPDGAFVGGGAPATMLLTGFGLQLPGVNISSGTVEVYAGPPPSTSLNFDVGQSLTNIANQWSYANAAIDGYNLAGVLPVDSIVSSVNNGGATRFAGPPPATIDGPGYGALSALETEFGSSTPGVQDTIEFVLTLDGAAPSVADINAGNVVLAFGSPTAVVPEPSTLFLVGLGFVGMALVGRRFHKSQV
jgi:hypothetical protein